MKNSYSKILAICLGVALTASLAKAQSEELSGTVLKWGDRVIPITVTGFSGEVDAVLKFDLYVMGCSFVPAEQAAFAVSGNYSGQLQGFLAEARSKKSMFGKAYTGGSARVLAHTFANDIIYAITGNKGIAGTRIAFKVEANRGSEIYVSDFDGYGATAATRDGSIVSAPCWRPGHHTLFYGSYKSQFPDIYSHDLDSGTRKPVAKYPGSNISPAVSRKGQVAMILSKAGTPNLYVADADGGNLRRLTHTKEGEACPCWSPDGNTVCFVSRANGRAQLFTIPASGGQMTRLRTDGVLNATEPDWSPDGKTIIFTTLRGDFEICTVPATGGTVTTLVAGQDPAWAPNSRTAIIVQGLGHGKAHLSLLDVPTKHVKDCLQISGSASQPTWAR